MNRRKLFETEGIIRNACTHAAGYLDSVVRGKEIPVMGRIRAAETILDRFLGKPKESVNVQMSVTAQVEELPWVQAYVNPPDLLARRSYRPGRRRWTRT